MGSSSARSSRWLASIVAVALAGPQLAHASAPVPVQRPSGVRTPPPAEAPVVEAPPAEAPVVEAPLDAPAGPASPEADAPVQTDAEPPADVAEPVDDPPAEGPRGRIAGTVFDTELAGVGVPDVSIIAVCPCLDEPIDIASDYDGRFEIDGLPAGTYTLHFDRGGRTSKRILSLADGQRAKITVDVAPPTETTEIERREKIERRAATMIAAGSVAGLAGLVMIIAAGVEANKPPCMFGLDTCSNAPRPAFAKGLGIGGALAVAGGATLVLVGVFSRRRMRAAVAADNQSAALVISGRF